MKDQVCGSCSSQAFPPLVQLGYQAQAGKGRYAHDEALTSTWFLCMEPATHVTKGDITPSSDKGARGGGPHRGACEKFISGPATIGNNVEAAEKRDG